RSFSWHARKTRSSRPIALAAASPSDRFLRTPGGEICSNCKPPYSGHAASPNSAPATTHGSRTNPAPAVTAAGQRFQRPRKRDAARDRRGRRAFGSPGLAGGGGPRRDGAPVGQPTTALEG